MTNLELSRAANSIQALRPLTLLETAALSALCDASACNGHDFGCMEEVRWDGDRKALGALVSNLSKLGLVHVYPREAINGGPRCGGYYVTQFVLAPDAIALAESDARAVRKEAPRSVRLCSICGEPEPAGMSCGCFDNGSQ